METKITAKNTQPIVLLKDKVRYFAYKHENYSLLVNKIEMTLVFVCMTSPMHACSYIINSMCKYNFFF